MTNLINQVNVENKVAEDWNISIIVNCFKNKREVTERGNYRGLKLL